MRPKVWSWFEREALQFMFTLLNRTNAEEIHVIYCSRETEIGFRHETHNVMRSQNRDRLLRWINHNTPWKHFHENPFHNPQMNWTFGDFAGPRSILLVSGLEFCLKIVRGIPAQLHRNSKHNGRSSCHVVAPPIFRFIVIGHVEHDKYPKTPTKITATDSKQ